ncbi:hypothetical protein G9F71_016415 [Clostridium sp. FP2]|nr:hypothetical protein [Clostridium sp. FP2]MBZ9624436.1 hypothetical protein [Clostridium sp. FP2]
MIKDKIKKQTLLNELLNECSIELNEQMFGRRHIRVLHNNIRISPTACQ